MENKKAEKKEPQFKNDCGYGYQNNGKENSAYVNNGYRNDGYQGGAYINNGYGNPPFNEKQ